MANRLCPHRLGALLLWLFVLGCQAEQADVTSEPVAESTGSESTGSESTGGSAEEDNPVLGYSVEELPGPGAYLPDLDAGRLRIAPPKDWRVASRSKNYVVRFDRKLALPVITVTVADAQEESPDNLNAENVAEFAAAVAEELDDNERAALRGTVEPLMLGEIATARYERTVTFRKGSRLIRGEREVIETIRNGRRYTIVLDANMTTLVDYRADAYSVVAWLEFPTPDPTPE